MENKVVGIPAFKDNYIWVLFDPDSGKAAVIDPGDGDRVLNYLSTHKLSLEAILITHHHSDHIGGVEFLKNYVDKNVTVYIPKKEIHRIKNFDVSLSENDNVELSFCTLKVMELPGHTIGHIAYFDDNKIFCGDTLFSAGCGRVFEGTMSQMYDSLKKISSLNEETQIYCAHEYTENNLLFAINVEPENIFIQNRYREVKLLREKYISTIPTNLLLEKKINPFLRCHLQTVRNTVEKIAKKKLEHPVEIFSYLRNWKDNF